MEIHVAKVVVNDLLISSPIHIYSMTVGILCAYEYDLYLQLLLEYEHSLNYISVLTNHDNDVGYPLVKQDNDILSPKPYGNLNYLLNVNSFSILAFSKTKTFIETKVTAMKLQGFNL
jgi:hypothetical protein